MFPRYLACLPCLPLTRRYLVAKDLFAVPDVLNDEFGWWGRPWFVTQGGGRRGRRGQEGLGQEVG